MVLRIKDNGWMIQHTDLAGTPIIKALGNKENGRKDQEFGGQTKQVYNTSYSYEYNILILYNLINELNFNFFQILLISNKLN